MDLNRPVLAGNEQEMSEMEVLHTLLEAEIGGNWDGGSSSVCRTEERDEAMILVVWCAREYEVTWSLWSYRQKSEAATPAGVVRLIRAMNAAWKALNASLNEVGQ